MEHAESPAAATRAAETNAKPSTRMPEHLRSQSLIGAPRGGNERPPPIPPGYLAPTLDAVRSAHLRVLTAAALFSTGGALIKAATLTGWQVACFRSAVGALAILAMAPESRRGWTPRTLLVGCAYASTVLLFVLANRTTTSANAIFLQSTAPIYLLLLGPFLLKEPLKGRDLLLMAVIAAGLACFFLDPERPQATAPDPFLGNVLAAASGVTWALTVAGLRWLARSGPSGAPTPGHDDNPAASATVAGNAIACLAALPFALPVENAAGRDLGIVLVLGVFQIGLVNPR